MGKKQRLFYLTLISKFKLLTTQTKNGENMENFKTSDQINEYIKEKSLVIYNLITLKNNEGYKIILSNGDVFFLEKIKN